MKLSLVLFCLSFATAAFAQRGIIIDRPSSLTMDARRLAAELSQIESRLSRSQAEEIRVRLSDIRNIMYGYPMPQPIFSYTCVSRDNDNRAPYVFGIRDGISVRRIAGQAFSSIESCNRAIESIVLLGNYKVFCGSRDGDDRTPYQLVKIESDGALTKVPNTIASTLQGCDDTLKKMRVNAYDNTVTFCTSRDNDSRAPYRAIQMSLDRMQVMSTGTELFSDIGSCWNFIGVY